MKKVFNYQTLIHFVKFNIIGVINTLVGYSIVFGSMYFFNLDAKISNMLGYGIGVLCSYYLNRKFTFKSEANVKSEIIKFFGVFIVAYIFNFITLITLIEHFYINEYIAQIVSAVVYTMIFFILSKFFVFKDS